MKNESLSEALEMEMLGITDYEVYQRQPMEILAYRRTIRSERARLEKVMADAAARRR